MSDTVGKFKAGLGFLKREFWRISFLKTIKYNYLNSHVIRRNGGFLIIYKKTVIVFEKGAKLEINGGPCYIGFGNPWGSSHATLIFLNCNSYMIMQSQTTICYGADIVVKPLAKLTLNNKCFLNCKCIIRCHYSIDIGADCITGTEIDVRDINDHAINGERKKKATIIGDHVWLGARVTVLGAEIGAGCVIGACSLVTKKIPAYSIAYGVPAQVHQESISWDF